MEQTECSETSTYKIETPGNYPKENTLYNKLLQDRQMKRIENEEK